MSMYVPRSNAIEAEQEIRRLVADVGTAQLITVGRDGYPLATLLRVTSTGSCARSSGSRSASSTSTPRRS
jgi:hypothetical protein